MKDLIEMAKELGVHPATLRAWTKAKLIPYHRFGKKYFFDDTELKSATLFEAETDIKELQKMTSRRNGITLSNGYFHIYIGNHPMANKSGYIPLHRIIIQASIGRVLDKKEVVHHKNGNTLDNRLVNLEIVNSIGEHNAQNKSMEEST